MVTYVDDESENVVDLVALVVVDDPRYPFQANATGVTMLTLNDSEKPQPVRRLAWDILALLALPFAIYAFAPERFYPPLQHDSWLYHGCYIDLPAAQNLFANDYYSSRLTITIPGWLMYSALPPIAANLVLHLLLYYAGVFSLFYTVTVASNRRAGFLAAMVLGGHGFYQLAIASDYTDGYCCVYHLLALACGTRAATATRWQGWAIAAGIAASALVVANLVYVVFVPGIVLHYLLLNRKHSTLTSAAFFVFGSLGLIVALGAFHFAIGGQFWFLAPSFTFAGKASGANVFKAPIASWLPHAVWLVVPAIAVLGTLVWCLFSRRGSAATVWFQIHLLLAVTGLVYFESTPQVSFLQNWFYATPLLVPLSMLALGTQWGTGLGRLSPRAYCTVAAVAILLFGIADFANSQYFRMANSQRKEIVESCRLNRCDALASERPATFLAIHTAMQDMQKLDPERLALAWYDMDEPNSVLFDNLACLNGWGLRIINPCFPKVWGPVQGVTGTPLKARQTIVVFSNRSNAEIAAKASMATVGVTLDVVEIRDSGAEEYRFAIILFRVSAVPAAVTP